ncbi:MAG: DNA damage-inducible protein D [Rhodobacteraceae bacterium]|nr:DNA damage-inducible protein D [Paracoccaceae bacterium]
MSGKDDPKQFSLDMSFDEALGRFVQADPEETRDVQNEIMPEATIDGLIDAFEASAQQTEEGIEFWYGRDLQKLFDYAKWEKFEQVIAKAVTACTESDNNADDHFVEVFPHVGKNPQGGRPARDFMLSRYACYLTAMNGDARKRPVSFAQTYFAIQTRKQEVAERDQAVAVPMSEDEKRVFIRNQLKEHNKYLASAAKGAGVVTPDQFAIFQSKGYQGLYGKTVPEIRRYKGLAKSAQILDRMGSTELAANFFRVTQTEEKLRKENVKGVQAAYNTHYEVGRQVRDAMLKISGVAPEDLPAVEGIKNAEKRLKAVPPPTMIEPEPSPTQDDSVIDDEAFDLQEVDLRKDLWKYALLIMVQRPNMEISTSDLIAELPNYIRIPDGAEANNSSRGDSKFSQIVRNLKSHKDSATNFIHLGYAEGIPRGFRATDKGREFVLKFFEGRI